MLKSKLSPSKYPMADPKLYLVFDAGVNGDIDPVFAGRLAAFTRDYGKGQKMYVNSGYRPIEKQITLFLDAGGKYDNKLGYYWPSSIKPSRRTVAKPGKSFHQYRLAIDTRSVWAKAINKTEATMMQTILLKYGLFKPMTVGNGMPVLEDWHFQPIETLNVPVDKRAEWMPTSDDITVPNVVLRVGTMSDDVRVLQTMLNRLGKPEYHVATDGKFGPMTEKVVKKFQSDNRLTDDGVVGPMTWNKLKLLCGR